MIIKIKNGAAEKLTTSLGDTGKLIKGLEIGMYDEAHKQEGMPFGVWLEKHIQTPEGGDFDPTPWCGKSQIEQYIERKAMKARGEEISPNAFEIALQCSGIKAFGQYTDIVSKLYETSNPALVLFPYFVSSQVYTGALMASLVPNLIAEVVIITNDNFRKIYLEDSETDRQTALTAPGEDIAEKSWLVKKYDVYLDKYAVGLRFTYEDIRDVQLNVLSVGLQKVGAQLGIDETDDCIYAGINGDGNSNGLEAAQTKTTQVSGAIEKKDVISLAAALPLPYKLKTFVGRKAYMIEYWDALSDMQNPAAQWGMTGMTLPMGHEWDRDIVPSDRFIGFDPNLGISYVTNDNATMTETDKIIGKQQVLTIISKRSKISVIDQDAIGALDIEHA